MNPLIVLGILSLLIVYMIVALIYIKTSQKRKEIEVMMTNEKEKRVKTFAFEEKLIRKFNINPNKIAPILYIERIIILSVFVIALGYLKGLAMCIFGAIGITIYFSDLTKKAIYDSGIENVGKVTNFINYFVPHINSGNSADQSLLGYIEYSRDEELAEYYENKDNIEYELPTHLKQITDIYDIAKYNEEQGIADYTYILNELAQDYAQKQVYYNSFVSRIGEIQPICWAYYISVPVLIIVSLKNTWSFWTGIWGFVAGFVLLLFFFLFKLLIYRLQKKTIIVMF